MRLARLRWPEWLIGAGSALLLASTLALHWYAKGVDGWHGLRHARWLIVVTVVVGFGVVLLQATRRGPAVPVTISLLAALVGAITTLWLIYRVLISPPGHHRLLGGFVGLAGALAIAYGGWRSLRLEGIAGDDTPRDIPVVDLTQPPPDPDQQAAT